MALIEKSSLPICAGLACLKAGFFAYAFTEGIFPYLSSHELMTSLPTILSYVAMACALTGVPLLSKYYGELHRHRWLLAVCTILVTGGSLAGVFSTDPFAPDGWAVASALCVGGASSPLFIMWGEIMAEYSYQGIKTQVSMTLVMTFVLYLLALVMPYPLSTVLVVVFPLVSGVIMFLVLRKGTSPCPASGLAEPEEMVSVTSSWKKWLWLLGLPHFMLSAIATALWSLVNFANFPDRVFLMLVSFGLGLLFAVVLFLVVADRENRLQVSALMQYAVPMLVIAPIAIALGWAAHSWIFMLGFALLCSTTIFVDFLNWILFCELAHENPGKRTRIIGWGRAFVYIGMLAGCLCGLCVARLAADFSSFHTWFVLLAVVALLAMGTSIFVSSVEQMRFKAICRNLRKQNPGGGSLSEADARYFKDVHAITPREFDVLALLFEGLTVPQIQDQLFLSANTVNTHVKRIYRKLDVHTRIELRGRVERILAQKGDSNSGDEPT